MQFDLWLLHRGLTSWEEHLKLAVNRKCPVDGDDVGNLFDEVELVGGYTSGRS